ncbi:hypothetical protein ACHAXN_010693 [Cyclotella atomus]
MPHQRDRNAFRPTPTSPPQTANIHRFAIRIAWNGSTYKGFQSQPYGNTIQDQIEHKLQCLFKRHVGIVAWGRTDAGVHANAAVITIDLTDAEVTRLATRSDGDMQASKAVEAAQFLLQALKRFACSTGVSDREGRLRLGSISALNVVPVPLSFDARYSARWKRYVYYICSGGESIDIPFAWLDYSWRVPWNLDFDGMVKAAELLNGKEHNYEWLSVIQNGELRSSRRALKLTVEEVKFTATLSDMPYFLRHATSAKLYKVTATSDFFLYKMIRRIVGMLVSIGRGHATLTSLAACIDMHDKSIDCSKMKVPKELVETAPPNGLCLEHIEYDIPI